MKQPKIHFYLLLLGSVFYLINLASISNIDGSGDRALLEIWALKGMLWATACYVIFASLVIAHGIPGHKMPPDLDEGRAEEGE
jgi:hypothetical protein